VRVHLAKAPGEAVLVEEDRKLVVPLGSPDAVDIAMLQVTAFDHDDKRPDRPQTFVDAGTPGFQAARVPIDPTAGIRPTAPRSPRSRPGLFQIEAAGLVTARADAPLRPGHSRRRTGGIR
jgi:hypothetical protein